MVNKSLHGTMNMAISLERGLQFACGCGQEELQIGNYCEIGQGE